MRQDARWFGGGREHAGQTYELPEQGWADEPWRGGRTQRGGARREAADSTGRTVLGSVSNYGPDATGFGDTRRAVGAGHLLFFTDTRERGSMAERGSKMMATARYGSTPLGSRRALAGATTFNLRLIPAECSWLRAAFPPILHTASGFSLRF